MMDDELVFVYMILRETEDYIDVSRVGDACSTRIWLSSTYKGGGKEHCTQRVDKNISTRTRQTMAIAAEATALNRH